jgi:hypothetical protein
MHRDFIKDPIILSFTVGLDYGKFSSLKDVLQDIFYWSACAELCVTQQQVLKVHTRLEIRLLLRWLKSLADRDKFGSLQSYICRRENRHQRAASWQLTPAYPRFPLFSQDEASTLALAHFSLPN